MFHCLLISPAHLTEGKVVNPLLQFRFTYIFRFKEFQIGVRSLFLYVVLHVNLYVRLLCNYFGIYLCIKKRVPLSVLIMIYRMH